MLYSLPLLTIFVMVFATDAAAEDAPKITMAPQNHQVMEDNVISFFCKASGHPAPDIYWQKNGKRINTRRRRYQVIDLPHGSVLRIDPVKLRRDEASYTCVADNGMGEPAISASVDLIIYPQNQPTPSGFPEITTSPSLKAVENGRNTVMMCGASGTPAPEIKWLKDSIPVDTSNARFQVLDSGSLQIESAQESDEGKYECIAENEVGTTYSYPANLYVRVRRVPPHFPSLPENQDVFRGGSVNLTCIAVGSPMPYVKWLKGSQELTPIDSIPIGRNVLMLTNVRESANYTCMASSELGNIEANVQVRVKAPGSSPT